MDAADGAAVRIATVETTEHRTFQFLDASLGQSQRSLVQWRKDPTTDPDEPWKLTDEPWRLTD